MLQDPSLWIGEAPDRWRLAKGKELFVQVKRPDDPELEVVTAFRDGVVTRRSNRRTTGFTEAVQFSGYQGVQPGDLVIHQMDGFAGAIGVSDSTGRCSPVCAVAVPRSTANPYYYARVLRAMAVSGWIAALAKGIRERSTDFRFSVFREQLVPVPSPEEQKLIVRYLDHAEMRIARAIAGKKRLIELLEERALASSEHLLLRGLRETQFVPTHLIAGVSEVPASWSTPLAQRVFKEVTIPAQPGVDEQLSLSQRDGLIPTRLMTERSLQTSSFDNWKHVEPGDLVLNRFKAHLGVFFAAKAPGMVSFHYGVFRPKMSIVTEFYELLFHTKVFRARFAGLSNGMTVGLQNLGNQSFYKAHILLPPPDEQIEIVRAVRKAQGPSNEAISALEKEIALLKEYRVRLISDVVTGKLDVRKEAAALPDVDPSELAAVLAGGATSTDEEEGADGDE
jgi:type I restriction enzyme S subunit